MGIRKFIVKRNIVGIKSQLGDLKAVKKTLSKRKKANIIKGKSVIHLFPTAKNVNKRIKGLESRLKTREKQLKKFK